MVRNLTPLGATLVALVLGAAPGCDGVNPIGGGGWVRDNKPIVVQSAGVGAFDLNDLSNVGVASFSFDRPESGLFVYGGIATSNEIEFASLDAGQDQDNYDEYIEGTWHRIDFRITPDNPYLGCLTQNQQLDSCDSLAFIRFDEASGTANSNCPTSADIYHSIFDEFNVVFYFPGDDVENNCAGSSCSSSDLPHMGFPFEQLPSGELGSGGFVINEIAYPVLDFVCSEFEQDCLKEDYCGPSYNPGPFRF